MEPKPPPRNAACAVRWGSRFHFRGAKIFIGTKRSTTRLGTPGVAACGGKPLDGAVHLPICGWSRSFGNALTQQEVIDVYRNKILDHPVQSHAFCILISAVGEVQVAFLERGMYSVVCLQMHDGLVVDMPLREEKEAKAIVDQKLKENWYLRKLEELHEGRKFPLGYDYKEMARYDGLTE